MLFKKILVIFSIVIIPAIGSEAEIKPNEIKRAISPFFADSELDGAVGIWMRSRTRENVVDGVHTAKVPNLDHGSLNLSVNFKSGYYSNVIGFDANLYATFDMWQNASPDHEMNFWGINNPYDKEPTSPSGCSDTWEPDCNQNGGQIQTASFKFKSGHKLNARLGLFQPSVPTAIAVNWSFSAGTYTGGELGGSFGDLALGIVVADEYRAPWFKDSYEFRTSNGKDAGQIYSLGAKYNVSDTVLLDMAFAGMTNGERKNAHIKYKHKMKNGWTLSPQLYIVDDDELYSSTLFQVALLSSKSAGAYSLRAEATYSAAERIDKDLVGNMSYRLTETYGGSNGAYDVWWNNRSDFNHDGEIAIFGSVARDMSDVGADGLSIDLSGAYGFGAKSRLDGIDELVEYSASGSLIYRIQKGTLKGADLSMHCTYYVNDSNAENWAVYTNAFQDETDLIVTLAIPIPMK